MTAEQLMRPPLDGDRLRARLLGAGSLWRRVDVVTATGSTNSDLVRAAAAGAPAGSVLAADEQLSGRGRLGRGWQAPARSSLAVSVLLRPPPTTQGAWGWLPLLVGVGVVDAVQTVAGVSALLKWPNDVLVDDRKLAGILAERVNTEGGPAAVVGVGLNVSQTADELPVAAAVSLAGCGAGQLDRTDLAGALLMAVAARYREWLADPDAVRTAYLIRSGTVHRTVRVQLPGGQDLNGPALDVDRHGRLVVGTPAGEVAVAAGDVVHVR